MGGKYSYIARGYGYLVVLAILTFTNATVHETGEDDNYFLKDCIATSYITVCRDGEKVSDNLPQSSSQNQAHSKCENCIPS